MKLGRRPAHRRHHPVRGRLKAANRNIPQTADEKSRRSTPSRTSPAARARSSWPSTMDEIPSMRVSRRSMAPVVPASSVARATMTVPPRFEGARRLEAQRCDLLRDRTHCVNRLRAACAGRTRPSSASWTARRRGRSRSCRASAAVADAGRRTARAPPALRAGRAEERGRQALGGAPDRDQAHGAAGQGGRPRQDVRSHRIGGHRLVAVRGPRGGRGGRRRDMPVPAHGARRRPGTPRSSSSPSTSPTSRIRPPSLPWKRARIAPVPRFLPRARGRPPRR